MRFKRPPPYNVEELLRRLGIRAKKIAPTKWAASCPNPAHQDRNPSWFIRDEPMSRFHATHCCKSCGFEGSTLSLVQKVLGLEKEAALEWLEDLAGPVKHPLRIELDQKMFLPCGRKGMLVPMSVTFDPDGWEDQAVQYLNRRNITDQQIERWTIGAINTSATEIDFRGKRRLHRLKGRVWIPFYQKGGVLLSYTARDYTGESDKRYLEPTRDEGHDRNAVFGEEYWGCETTCIVVEGPFDLLAVERVVSNVALAALRGSSPSPLQLSKLLRFEKLIVCTDNDDAGNHAAREIAQQCGSHCHVVRMAPPLGKDLADMEEPERAAFFAQGGITGTT